MKEEVNERFLEMRKTRNKKTDILSGWPGTNLDGVEALNALPRVCQEHVRASEMCG